ncbi:bifunctional trehalose-phosphatase/glycoside hydrolase family 15 protein [Pseudarthrobacter sp. NIBRBAC000502772]|uniref:trehalase-like domain-containing protein n=1 Tax=Pseudarthrobacter sp. NIBRBAC000502772 TaxID=2590775 RepID=UPI001131FADC|nr:trehalase-like domain-containing protein [Pseudarthrobacter sp. NIBRBAC000502772]QDG66689.1 bifunctional trehalose-phosphatase/glycoside hydrolase family 15 protein [Pseudarthrobacter sp. NIBRBAC000502772]
MTTPVNRSVTNSALLTTSLPQGLLRALIRSDTAGEGLSPLLVSELKVLARTPNLLVACNYGGTLSDAEGTSLVTLPVGSAAVALRALAALPNTHAAVISGRSLRDLAAVSRLPAEVLLVGSHGAEFDMAFAYSQPPGTTAVLHDVRAALTEVVRAEKDFRIERIERKPLAVALRLIALAPDVVARLTAKAEQIAKDHGLYFIVDGSVLDLSVVEPSKGHALERLRSELGISAALYAGDGPSDEFALATLRGPDLGLRVGEGPAPDGHRVRDPEAFAMVLAVLFELRRAWLFGEDAVGLERHSLLGDGSSTALVTPDAKICWMTHPLPDSGSLFAHILGGDAAGHFSVEPLNTSRVLGQRYVDNTMIVETRWADVTVTDYLEQSGSGITNLVRVLSGTGAARIVFAPRPDYTNAPFSMEVRGSELHVLGTSDPIVLHAPGVGFSVSTDGRHATATAEVNLRNGPVVLNLRCGDTDHFVLDPAGEADRRAAVAARSREWVRKLELPTVKPSLVRRSALVLRAMVHEPTGGVLAAPTTSLPEGIGGIRNWDYRYCWLRDGSMTVKALVDLGSTQEAEGFLRWLGGILEKAPGPEWLHPLYSVSGNSMATEATIESLPGYAGSRPVRIGNAADHQVQLDVFGPIADLIHGLSERHGWLTDFEWELLGQMAGAVMARWQEPDHGIWEARRPPRHHVYTKVMCWVTLDRALRTAARHGRIPDPRWETVAATIREEVLRKGWDEEEASYTVAYDSPDLDAAVLHIGLSGLLDVDDRRFMKTVSAVERVLRVGPTVFRYRYDDGLPGMEGGFHICTTWLIEAYVAVGRLDDARELFGQLVNLVGPTGLLPEEYDPGTETHLGNHPQAYSHLGLIRCAQRLDRHQVQES